jgi:hypothetical protein
MTTEGSVSADLNSTLAALRGGPATLSVKTRLAAPIIEGWQRKLEGAGDARLTELARDLGELKRQLSEPQLDRRAVGQLLSRLGERTAEVASAGCATEVRDNLDRLSGLLLRYGGTLSS